VFHGDTYSQYYCWHIVYFWVSTTLDVQKIWYEAGTVVITTFKALSCPDFCYVSPACVGSCAIYITGDSSQWRICLWVHGMYAKMVYNCIALYFYNIESSILKYIMICLLADSVCLAHYSHVPVLSCSNCFGTQLSSAISSNTRSWFGTLIFLVISSHIREFVFYQS
jgi:hypothetical protein